MNIKEAKDKIKFPDEVIKLLTEYDKVKNLYLKHKGDDQYDYMFNLIKKSTQQQLTALKVNIKLD